MPKATEMCVGIVYTAQMIAAPSDGAFAELDMVELLKPARTSDGQLVPAGSLGTVLTVWDDGSAYDVEFAEPSGVAAVDASDLVGSA